MKNINKHIKTLDTIKKIAIILGATGLTGNYLLEILLESNAYDKIKVFTRKTTGKTHSKLEETVCDVLKLEKYADNFTADEVFCCIGTTKNKTPDKKLYHNIDYGIPVKAAKLAEQNKIKTFIVISAIGATPQSHLFYSRTKGEMEQAILKKNIPNILIYRPSIIYGKRSEKRPFEEVGLLLTRAVQIFFFGKLQNYKPISAKDLAKALYLGAERKKGHQIIFRDTFDWE